MSAEQEATINPDGSTTFADDGGFADGSTGFDDATNNSTMYGEETDIVNEVDPAYYVLAVAAVFLCVAFLFFLRNRRSQRDTDDFFLQLDGEKFNLKLPAAVDEYYAVKAKAEESGWEPGQRAASPAAAAAGPQRVLAQALMKRCIADVPLVTHIQKESAGMNKLYSQSMCSVNQWRSYQAAESMVSAEVDEVRAEADEIEPGWSQVIWRQAMQYHNMLKQRHEMEAKALEAQAEKKKQEENKALAEKRKEEEARAKIVAAERAAEELIKQEDREKQSKSALNGGMKKGFLSSGKKK